MISPMKYIFALFGYVKIPSKAIRLSMRQEEAFKIIIKKLESVGCPCPGYRKALESQRALTSLLRSGRLLNDE